MFQKRNFLLILILGLAIFLRFWNLEVTPPSLSHDEVAIGYNAYSVLQTGKDEYGNFFPALFRSFDDYKLPGYIYTTVVSEKIFGLTPFAVRFPSAFFGVLTVLALYLFCRELIQLVKNKKDDLVTNQDIFPLMTAFALAISPWHVNFSRAAFESNGSVFFIVFGMWLLLKSLSNPFFYILSAISFAISIYFYYTARIIVPFIVLLTFLLYKVEFLQAKKWVIVSCMLAVVLLAPLVPYMITSGLSRVNQVSIFEDKSLTNPYSQAVVRSDNSPLAKVIYNRRVAYLQQFADNYLRNFAPDFYFTSGTGPMGLLYLWELPFFLFGIYLVARRPEKWKWIILGLFFVTPVVGGLTTGQPNALRTLPNAPIAALFTGVGLTISFFAIWKNRYKFVIIAILGGIISFFFIRFLTLYFDYNPYFVALNWGDGHKQMVEYVKKNKTLYDSIYITGDYWRPYIYYLFHSSYNPSLYQRAGSRFQIDTIKFGQASWDRGEGIHFDTADLSQLARGKTLYILSKRDYDMQKSLEKTVGHPYSLKIIRQIDGNVAKEAFYIVEIQQI